YILYITLSKHPTMITKDGRQVQAQYSTNPMYNGHNTGRGGASQDIAYSAAQDPAVQSAAYDVAVGASKNPYVRQAAKSAAEDAIQQQYDNLFRDGL
ncbi:MAG: hypothetical protein EZS28_007298, partial [Streblomastix strix]